MKFLAVSCLLIYFSPIIMMMISAWLLENKRLVKIMKFLERNVF